MKTSLGPQTIVYPHPVFIVGSYDSEGKANLMNAAWGGICCSRPPCVAVSMRAATYTHGCIMDRGAFTINIPHEGQVWEADYVGIYSGRKEDKLAATGLTAVRSELVDAPYVQEFPVVLECKLLHVHELRCWLLRGQLPYWPLHQWKRPRWQCHCHTRRHQRRRQYQCGVRHRRGLHWDTHTELHKHIRVRH